MKKYILFDNDGVLVETEKWYFEANKMALKDIGLNLQEDFYQQIMIKGGSVFELASLNGISNTIIEKQRKIRDSYYQEFLKTKNLAINGVEKTLKTLFKKYKMAIVTTSRRVDFELIHQKTNIVSFMDFVLCVEDYKKAKPNPEPYLKALEKFEAKSYEAIVVEDSQRGLVAAKDANIECVVVKNDFTKNQDFSRADYFINDFEELKVLL